MVGCFDGLSNGRGKRTGLEGLDGWGKGRAAGCLVHQLLDGHPYCQAAMRAGGCLLAHGGLGSPQHCECSLRCLGSVG